MKGLKTSVIVSLLCCLFLPCAWAQNSFQVRRANYASLDFCTNDEERPSSLGKDTSFFNNRSPRQHVILHEEICEGELYSGHGFNNIRINNDTLLACLIDNPEHSEYQDSLLIYINAHPSYHIPIDDSRCWQGQPGVYDGHGFSFVYDHPDTYDFQLELQTKQGCDSILFLHLVVDEQITNEFSHHECGNSYIWDGRPYSTPGDYKYTYTTPGGCDSIVTLHLTMGHRDTTSFDTIACSPFRWNGLEYTTSGHHQQRLFNIYGCDSIVDCYLTLSGDIEGDTFYVTGCDSVQWLGDTFYKTGHYEKTLLTSLGCDSLVHLNLELDYSPQPTEILPTNPENTSPHWVITATEFQINSYEFQVWDLGNTQWTEPVEWQFVKKQSNDEWTEDTDTPWILEPDTTTNPPGKRVTMYVIDQVEDTIWLAATIKNNCAEITRRTWFVSSFYSMDETIDSKAVFDIVPNPSDGQLTLNFEHWNGQVEVKVYDMLGSLVDHLLVESGVDHLSLPYQLNVNSGVYCLVATGRNKTIAKKVIITH